MSRKLLFTLLALGLAASSHATTVYKWVDENGVTHFGERPIDDSAEQMQLEELSSYSAPPVTESSTQASGGPEIIMYSTSWCGYCKQARAYFKQNNIAFTEYDIEKNNRALGAYKKLGGTGSVPLFSVDGKAIRGFSKSNFQQYAKK